MAKKKASKSGKKKAGGAAKAPAGRPAAPAAAPAAAAGPPALGPNPYDAFQNRRRRHKVLGERHVKGERRNVVASRARAEGARAAGLLAEAYSMRRTSSFKDSRLGGGAAAEGLDPKDRTGVQRLVKLRQKQTRKSFNLKNAAPEELTVGGRPLSGLADDELRAHGRGSDSELDEDAGRGADPDDPVARDRRQKAELARERAEHEQMLGRLDTDFTDIMGELRFKTPKKLAPLGDKDKPDGYDQLVRQLGQERKAQATDRTKTAEELAQERADRLAALERERVARAEGVDLDAEAPASGDEADRPWDASGTPRGGGPPDPGAGEESSADDGDDEEGESGEEEEGEGEEEEAEDGQRDEDDKQGEGCPELLGVSEAAAVDITVNAAGEEGLPFAPECPSSLRGVQALLDGRPPRTALKLVQRVRACTAAALGAAQRAKLRVFFAALLEYAIGVLAREDGDLSARGVLIVYALRTPLVELAADHADEAHAFFAARLQAMRRTRLPKAGDFCCLKLIALLFPVTDLQHPVCTPASLLADHWAANLAALGAGIEDLVSEGTLLFGILYDFCSPPRRFCASFFNLGAALLESCAAAAFSGRLQCAEAASAIVALLGQALREFAEADGSAAATLLAHRVLRPTLAKLERGASAGALGAASPGDAAQAAAGDRMRAVLEELRSLCAELECGGLEPLALFESARPQIKVLDPIFHEVGDRPRKGMELSETKQLQRRLTQERRAASRQLSRDAAVLQRLQSEKEAQVRVKRVAERKRVTRIMDQEAQELKKMRTETDGGMDTSIRRYTAKKEQKLANKRQGGNATAETAKAAAGKEKGDKAKRVAYKAGRGAAAA